MYALPLNYTSAVVDRYFPPNGVDESLNASELWREAFVETATFQYRRVGIGRGGAGANGGGGDRSNIDGRSKYSSDATAPWSPATVRGVIDATVRAVAPSAWPSQPCSTNFYTYNDDCAGPAPQSPLDASTLVGPPRKVKLLPFGAIDIGFGELPFVAAADD